MRLFKKDNMDDFIISKDLSIGVTGMLNSLLVRTNYELENTDIYSLSNDSRKDVALAFRELRKKNILSIIHLMIRITFMYHHKKIKVEKDVYTFEEFQKYITGTTNLNDKTMYENVILLWDYVVVKQRSSRLYLLLKKFYIMI